jgi:hypothetical protein
VTIEEARAAVGRSVVYVPHLGAEPEVGTITAVSDSHVFVRYGRDQLSKATLPELLAFEVSS